MKDLTLEMLVNALTEHMQSNKIITINNGWTSNVVITKIENDGKKRMKQTKVNKLYKNLGKGIDKRGGVNELRKYGRDFSLGTFNINYDELGKKCKDACFAVCLLIGLHYLKKTKGWELLTMRKKTIDEVLNEEEILDFYEQIGKGRVSCAISGSDFPIVYKKFLKAKNVDLVVFSLTYNNTIVYDLRTDETGRLIRLTNDVVGVWLNNNHYDLVLNFSKFIYRNSKNKICMQCMKRQYENHICTLPSMCFLCYTFHDRTCDLSLSVVCSLCDLYFKNKICLKNHYSNKGFDFDKKYSPFQFFKYCHECKMIVQRKRFSYDQVKMHKCNKIFCKKCNRYIQKPHFCFMTPIELTKVENPSSTPIFFDFETKEDEITYRLLLYYCVVEKVCFKCENKEFEKDENGKVVDNDSLYFAEIICWMIFLNLCLISQILFG